MFTLLFLFIILLRQRRIFYVSLFCPSIQHFPRFIESPERHAMTLKLISNSYISIVLICEQHCRHRTKRTRGFNERAFPPPLRKEVLNRKRIMHIYVRTVLESTTGRDERIWVELSCVHEVHSAIINAAEFAASVSQRGKMRRRSGIAIIPAKSRRV